MANEPNVRNVNPDKSDKAGSAAYADGSPVIAGRPKGKAPEMGAFALGKHPSQGVEAKPQIEQQEDRRRQLAQQFFRVVDVLRDQRNPLVVGRT